MAYGSDYEVIETQFALNTYEPSREPRWLFRNTNWPKARQLVSASLLQNIQVIASIYSLKILSLVAPNIIYPYLSRFNADAN